jgi:hypothetical protein
MILELQLINKEFTYSIIWKFHWADRSRAVRRGDAGIGE